MNEENIAGTMFEWLSMRFSTNETAYNYIIIMVVCRYTKEKFGWDKKKCDQELLPVIQRLNQKKEVL